MSVLGAMAGLSACCSQSEASSLQIWLKLAAEADWKEKQVKCAAYGLSLLGWLASRPGSSALSSRLRAGSRAFSMARRILWIGRLVQNWPRLRTALNEPDWSTRIVSVAGLLLGSLLFIVDDLITGSTLGLLPSWLVTKHTWQLAGLAWWGTTVCALLLQRWKFRRLQSEFERNLARLGEFKLWLDLGLNTPYACGEPIVSRLPSGWFAVMGLSSGLVGSFKVWVCAHHAENLERRQTYLLNSQLPSQPQSVPIQPRTVSCDTLDQIGSIDLPEPSTDNAPRQKTRRLRRRRPSSASTPALSLDSSRAVQLAPYEWRRCLSSTKIATSPQTVNWFRRKSTEPRENVAYLQDCFISYSR